MKRLAIASMSAYRKSVWVAVVFTLLYPLISGAVLVFGRSRGIDEIYPVAPWALFCFVPTEENDFAVLVRSAGERHFSPPVYLEDFHAFSERQMTVGYSIVQVMGRRSTGLDRGDFELERGLLESSFLEPVAGHGCYELVKRSFNVLDRWRDGECREVESIGIYTFGELKEDL